MEISPISNDSSAKFKTNVKFTVDYANADSNTIDNITCQHWSDDHYW